LVTPSSRRLARAYFRYLRDLGESEVFYQAPHFDLSIPTRTGDVSLESIALAIRNCRNCGLHMARTNPVPGAGNPHSGLVMVGEAPGEHEDIQGVPFVGPSGRLLRRLFTLAGIPENGYYLVNVLKCRPPGNRDPSSEEIQACRPFLEAQLKVLAPRLIVCLGRFAGWHVLDCGELSMRDMRGAVHQRGGVSVVVTYHPSALLHKPDLRAEAWRDIKMFRRVADQLALGVREAP